MTVPTPTTKRFLIDLGERVVATFAASLLAIALAAQPFNVLEFDWGSALTVSVSAAFLTLLKGLVAQHTGPTDGAGLGT